MVSDLEAYYLSKEEPTQSCLLALRQYLLEHNENMSETWTHKMPMFKYKGKLFAYLWIDKKTYTPYIGIYRGIDIEHPKLVLGNRNKMKTMHIDPELDLPLKDLNKIMKMALALYD